ncbi:9879_t:CDS:2 [Cetraspora pellucida]|uniref:9879_t:CDS:1 n=1 Tax=Cetraspora pellucida TaxID=1433469 RepID=A0A9N8VEL3_9GLOM|nr:9879_t:CDS:2 [Cetraspora pellucida]
MHAHVNEITAWEALMRSWITHANTIQATLASEKDNPFSEMNEPNEAPNIDPQTKEYIDDAQLEQVNLTDTEKQPDNNQLPEEDHTSPLTIDSTDTRELITQGNYPPTPILNEIIANIKPSDVVVSKDNMQKSENQDQTNKQLIVKKGSRRFPTIEYKLLKNLPIVQGFNNPLAAEIESRRLWWVLNWNEGQKTIEMLAYKPSLTSKLWKTIAFGTYAELQEFAHKNIKANMKYLHDDSPLQISEGAILILYDIREQELNFYRDHISTLCTKYEFSAVMSYDEDRRLELTMNRQGSTSHEQIKQRYYGMTTERSALTGTEDTAMMTRNVAGFMHVCSARK